MFDTEGKTFPGAVVCPRIPGPKLRLRRAFVLFVLLACGCFGTAQEVEIQDLTSLSLEDLSRVRLFTASRHLDDPRKAPAAVTVIESDEITRSGWRTLGELLRSITGFYTAYDRTYTYTGVRGFLQSGDYNARILLLIDGHRVNENIYDSALVGTEFPLDLNLVDHIEVVRGAGSSLYGTNAEFAVINVFTKQAGARNSVETTGDVESFRGRGAEIVASGRLNGASGIASGSIFRSNGPANLYFPEFDSPPDSNGIAHDIDGMRYEHAFGSVRRGALRIEGLFGKRTKIVPNATYGTLFNDPNNRDVDTRAYLDATWNHDFNSDTQLDLRVYYDAYRYWSSYPYADNSPGGRTIQVNDAAVDWLGVEAIVGHRIGRHRVVAGTLNEFNARLNQRNYYIGQAPFLDDHRTPRLSAVFGEMELNPNKYLTFNLGAREDWYSQFGSSFSPRAAVMFFPTRTTSLKYIYSRAFRAPDAYDEFYVDQIDITTTNTHLKPEHIDSQIFLLEKKFGKHVQVAADGFVNNLSDVIDEVQDPTSGTSSFANMEGDDAHGFEVEATAKFPTGWSARSSYTYSHTSMRAEEGEMENSPAHIAKLNATAPVRWGTFLNMELLYTSSERNFFQTRIPPYFLANTTFSTRPFGGGFQFFASCYNLLDRRYATPTGPELAQPATVQDGRTWRFRLTYRHNFGRKLAKQ